jgi:hypothetical protein
MQDRQCGGFTKRLLGSSPKEHRQMEIDQFIRDEAAKREREQLDWQSRLEEVNGRRQDDRDKSQRQWQAKQNKMTWSLQVLLAAATAMVGLGGVILGHYLTAHQPPQSSAIGEPIGKPTSAK